MIPKRIFQIWCGEAAMPMMGKASAANARLLNSGFEYTLLNEAGIQDVLQKADKDMRGAAQSFRIPIQRYDFIRCLVIYYYGGFYMDTDVMLVQGLDSLCAADCVFPFERLTWSDFLRDVHGMDWEIGNYAFGATAGHPFIRAVIENCMRAQKEPKWRDEATRTLPWPLRQELFVIYSTGPGLVSRTLAEYAGREPPVTVLWPENVWDKRNCWNRFGDYGIHLAGGTWRQEHGGWRRRLINLLGWQNEARAIRLAKARGRSRSLDDLRQTAARGAAAVAGTR
jgi:mannosyltransferase OCH1-like enzyme